MNPEQPPLAKMLAAAPLLLLHVDEPEPPVGDDQIGWPDRFIHEVNRRRPIVGAARSGVIVATLALALLIWRLARGAYGAGAGLFALALAAFHPSLLAHGHLATTDLLSAFTFLACSWAFASWMARPSAQRAVAVGGVLGLAVTTRHTAWLLPAVFALLLVPWLVSRQGRRRRSAPRQVLILVVGGAVAAWVTVWAVHGFHYAPWPGASAAQPIDESLGAPGRILAWMEARRALPESYLEGLRFQMEHNRQGHWGYLLGQRGSSFPAYYLVAYAVKNTPGFLLLTPAIAVGLWRGRRRLAKGSPELHWLLPAGALFLVASFANIQLGERYVLAVYPYVILLAAAAAARIARRPRGALVLAAVLLLHAGPALLAAPRGYLAYFNTLAGGPDGGHRVLADSNLDWGQDLPRLARWMKDHGVARVQLGYFGADDPDRYGIVHEDLPTWGPNRPQRPAEEPFRGTIAVSPNLQVGLFFAPEQDPYAFLRDRAPDARAGVLFIYDLP
jgi:hypothetical protein